MNLKFKTLLKTKIFAYFFAPRFFFSRFHLNLFAVLFIGIGLFTGIYLTMSKIILPSIFATQTITNTWTFNSSTASSYTYNSFGLTVDDNGAIPVSTLTNKFTNPNLTSDNSGWNIPTNSNFATKLDYTTGSYPNAVAIGNINGDTVPDMAVANYNANTVSVFINSGTGTSFAKTDYTTGSAPRSVAIGDLTGDGQADLIVGNSSSNTISVFTNKYGIGASTFSTKTDYTTGSYPRSLAVGDLNGDGNVDIAVSNGSSNTISVFINNGTGTNFTKADYNTGSYPYFVAIGDLTGDGKSELVSSNNGSTTISVFTNKYGIGASTFSTKTDYTTGSGPYSLNIGDLTGDGNADIAVVNTGSNTVSVFTNNGTGTNFTRTNYSTGSTPQFVAINDINGDSNADIAVVNSSSNTVSVFTNNGTGTNFTKADYNTGSYPFSIAIGDLTVDGKNDLAVTNQNSNTISIFVNTTSTTLSSQIWESSPPSGRSGGANKIIAGSSGTKSYQTINIASLSNYNISAYVYNNTTGSVGGTVDSSIAQFEYAGVGIGTTYTDVGSGWWKLEGTINNISSSQEFGIIVKASKTVYLDDFSLLSTKSYSPVYNTVPYGSNQIVSFDSISADTNTPGNSSVTYQICNNYSCSSWLFWNGSSWNTATNITTDTNTLDQLLMNNSAALTQLPITSKKFSIKAILNTDGDDVPVLNSISLDFTIDTDIPLSSISIKTPSGSNCTGDNCFSYKQDPAFNWSINETPPAGSNLIGYCLYIGNDPAGDPQNTSGNFQSCSSPYGGYCMDDKPCSFITSDLSSFDIGSATYADYYGPGIYYNYYYETGWDINYPMFSGKYYFNVKPLFFDSDQYIYTLGSIGSLGFNFDSVRPTNVAYISPASGNFSNVADMVFSWPNQGDNNSSSDVGSGVLGWQYKINNGDWEGNTTSPDLGTSYLPTTLSSFNLKSTDVVVPGNNIVYFRTVDRAGNYSSDDTIRTGNLSFGGAAPTFNQSDKVTIVPTVSNENSYSLSWPQATPGNDRSVTHYYYMINTPPPTSLATIQSNISTYIDNGTSTTVSTKALPNVNKGSNTVYVVSVDDEGNYSPSNYTSGTFELDSTNPDNVANLVASDSSIKSQSQWNVTLTWTAPVYQGAGNLTYQIYRSTNNVSFAQVGTSTGLSFVDNVSTSSLFYYKVYTKDGANSISSGTNTVSITPTGKWTSAPTLENQPTVTNITTKKATVTWSTNRSSDSKVAFGTTSGKYNDEEPSNSSQVSSHSINLTGLLPGTTYYYKTKWTDEDGNTGTSEEKSFTTAPAPVIKDVTVKNINLNSGLIQFTSTGASKVKVYYGNSTSFGGALEIPTSTNEATYTINLIGLLDGVKYYYKINAFDSENSEYEGTTLDFTTIARPKITNVQLQEVAGTSQSTILVTWDTNTEVSSIVTYYPEGQPDQSHDEVSVQLVKGEHKMILRGLTNQLKYTLIVKGRDRNGNEALSDTHRFTTASDTRPPQISSLSVEGQSVPQISGAAQEATAQLTVSWNTDEPATSQVEFSEGTGTDYSQKTQEDTKLTYNHLVIISNLTPSKVYHLKAVSRDKAFNTGKSIDTVTIAPKATDNALDLVVSNLSQVFGFLGGLGK